MKNMNIFPEILNRNDFEAIITAQNKPEIRFMEQDNGTCVCSYLISCDGTFNDSYSRECRGITFAKDGSVISRPLTKFFNVNQLPETAVNVIDWKKVVRVMDKRDGSMIHTADVPSSLGKFSLKSKKTFKSDVAIMAEKWMSTRFNYKAFCEYCVENDWTAIFEWTSPVARIVLGYTEDDMQLLHVRDNLTGEYHIQERLEHYCRAYEIPLVANCNEILDAVITDPAKVQEIADTIEGIEGWVFQFENGDMVKWKTAWYMERHHTMTNLRERDIAEAALNESLDDLKSILVGEGVNISEINEIEAKVTYRVDKIITEVTNVYEKWKHLDRKSIALKFAPNSRIKESSNKDIREDLTGYKYFGLLMKLYSGSEPDYKLFYKRNFLNEDFSLRQLNLLQTVADTEE